MIQITNTEEKQVIADRIKRLVEQINEQIELSNTNRTYIQVRFTQNTGIAPKNSHLNVFISETVSY